MWTWEIFEVIQGNYGEWTSIAYFSPNFKQAEIKLENVAVVFIPVPNMFHLVTLLHKARGAVTYGQILWASRIYNQNPRGRKDYKTFLQLLYIDKLHTLFSNSFGL